MTQHLAQNFANLRPVFVALNSTVDVSVNHSGEVLEAAAGVAVGLLDGVAGGGGGGAGELGLGVVEVCEGGVGGPELAAVGVGDVVLHLEGEPAHAVGLGFAEGV
jgi:hypothetical protein